MTLKPSRAQAFVCFSPKRDGSGGEGGEICLLDPSWVRARLRCERGTSKEERCWCWLLFAVVLGAQPMVCCPDTKAGKGQDCLCARPCPLPAVPALSSTQQGPSHPVRRKTSLQIPLWGITINFLHSPSAAGRSRDERPGRLPETEQGTRSCACGQQKARSSIPRPPGLRVCDSAPCFGRRKDFTPSDQAAPGPTPAAGTAPFGGGARGK